MEDNQNNNNNNNNENNDNNTEEAEDFHEFLSQLCDASQEMDLSDFEYPPSTLNRKYEYEGRIDTPLNFALKVHREYAFVSRISEGFCL